MRVLFTTAPLHGHFYPLVPLAWAHRLAGHEVLVACADEFTPTATQSGLPVVPVGSTEGVRQLADPGAAYGIRDAPYDHGQVFARMAGAIFPGVLALVDSWHPDLLIAERSEIAGPIAASAYGTPLVELHWGVPELTAYRAAARDILRDELGRLGRSELPEPLVTVNPWPPSLRHPHADGHLGVRAVAYDGIARVPVWLTEQRSRPRVCLTLGTVLPHLAAQGLTRLVVDMIHHLAKLGAELVLAVDDDLVGGLGPLPEEVRHAGRIPLSQALAGCDAVIHHGGHGSSLTALAAGCPQVVLPTYDDMFPNAEAIARCGAGLALPLAGATAEDIAAACGRILDGAGFRAAAGAVAGEIARQPSLSATVTTLARLSASAAGHAPAGHPGAGRPVVGSRAGQEAPPAGREEVDD